MGGFDNLYKPNEFPAANTLKDVIGAPDALNEKILLLLVIGAVWGMALIGSTCMLVDRWRGPRGVRKVGTSSVLAAIIMSTAWPLVFAYLIVAGGD